MKFIIYTFMCLWLGHVHAHVTPPLASPDEESVVPGTSDKQGSFGTALHFNGVDDYLYISDTKSTSLNQDFSIEIWIRPKSFRYINNVIFSKANVAIPENEQEYLDSLTPSSLILNGIYAYIPSFRHHLHVVIGDGLQYRHLECRDLRYFHVDTWMHVAVTWAQEKQQLIVYQDTKVILNETGIFRPPVVDELNPPSPPSSRTFDPTMSTNHTYVSVINTKGSPLYLGSFNGHPHTMFHGELDEFRIWRVVRQSWQIIHAGERQIAKRKFDGNLVGYYQMNEGKGDKTWDRVTQEKYKENQNNQEGKSKKKIQPKQARFRGSGLTTGKSWVIHQMLGWSAIYRDHSDMDGTQCYLFHNLATTVMDVAPRTDNATITEFTYYCKEPNVTVHLVTWRPIFYEQYFVVGKKIHQCDSIGVHRVILRPSERWMLYKDDVMGACIPIDKTKQQQGAIAWEWSEQANYRALYPKMPEIHDDIIFSWRINRTFSYHTEYIIGSFPTAPTITLVESIDKGAIIHFTEPISAGSAPSGITHYQVWSNDNITTTSLTSPITITGLNPGQTYTFTVSAVSSYGAGDESEPSLPIQPLELEKQVRAAGFPVHSRIEKDGATNVCLVFNNTYSTYDKDTEISSFDAWIYEIGHEIHFQTWRYIPYEMPPDTELPDAPSLPTQRMLGQAVDNVHYKGKQWHNHYGGAMPSAVCSFRLIGEYRVIPDRAGWNRFVIPKEQRWMSQQGDVMGFCHQYKGSIVYDRQPEERTLHVIMDPQQTKFPRMGETLAFPFASRRAFSIQANRVAGEGEIADPEAIIIPNEAHDGTPDDDHVTVTSHERATKQSQSGTTTPDPNTVVEVEIAAVPPTAAV